MIRVPRWIGDTRSKVLRNIQWEALSCCWVKVNSNGPVKHDGIAAAGGIIRDHLGTWISGFAHNLDSCSVPKAGLWGVFQSLQLTWNLGFKKVIVEKDSRTTFDLLEKQLKSSHPLSSLANLCHSFLRRDWDIQFRHIFREANAAADFIASFCSFISSWFAYFGGPACGFRLGYF